MKSARYTRQDFHEALLSEQLLAQVDPKRHTARPTLHQSYETAALLLAALEGKVATA